MQKTLKKRWKLFGKTFLFYGEIGAFMLAWVVAMWVVARQPSEAPLTPGSDQLAASSSISTGDLPGLE